MALVIDGEERIKAPIDKVWAALNDPAVLKQAIPGCQSLDMSSPTDMAATVVLKIGPIKATFHGEVPLKNLHPPHSHTIQGEGTLTTPRPPHSYTSRAKARAASPASPRLAPTSA